MRSAREPSLGETLRIGKGTVSIDVIGENGTINEVILHEVIHAPDMEPNLVSTTTLMSRGLEISMHPKSGVNILKEGRIVATTVREGRLFRLQTVNGQQLAAYRAARRTATERARQKAEDPEPLPLET